MASGTVGVVVGVVDPRSLPPLQVFHAITQLVLKQKREAEPQEAAGAGDKIVVRKGGKSGSGGGGKKKWSCTLL